MNEDAERKAKTLVRLRGREMATYEKVVEMTDKELRDLQRAFNTRNEARIAEEIDGRFDKARDVVDGSDLEDAEADIVGYDHEKHRYKAVRPIEPDDVEHGDGEELD